MTYGTANECACKECGTSFSHAKRLSNHVKSAHGLTPVAYAVKHEHRGQQPVCKSCRGPTRFVSIREGFKAFCQHCAAHLAPIHGRAGGRTKAMQAGAAVVAAPTSKRTKRARTAVVVPPAASLSPLAIANAQAAAVGTELAELAAYVTSLGFGVELGSMFAVPGVTVDVWIPSKQVAVELHVLDWRRPDAKPDTFLRGRHRAKYVACRDADVRLIQFFGDEWANKSEVCRSILANALGVAPIKLNARDCDLRAVPVSDSKAFLEANHISGAARSKHHVGLFHDKHGLVGIATTRTPIQKRHGRVCELSRMCFLRGCSVRGGASKLLGRVFELAQEDGFEGVLSYAELRFGGGGVYEKCGFELLGETLNNYGYSDGVRRYDRFKYRAQPGKTEKQVAEENDVKTVWGSGNHVYIRRFPSASPSDPSSSQGQG